MLFRGPHPQMSKTVKTTPLVAQHAPVIGTGDAGYIHHDRHEF